MHVHLLTSAAQVLLIDLDHELPINVSKHTAVHPVGHKPKTERWGVGEKEVTDCDFSQVRLSSLDFSGVGWVVWHKCQPARIV